MKHESASRSGTLGAPATIEVQHDLEIEMSDGVNLSADLYLPALQEPVPALLVRTPYDKRNAETEVYAHPAWYARAGYAVVVQDTRGRWNSGGDFYPFANERQDGAETISWITRQPWCSGRVGMYGFSYPGAAVMLAASAAPEGLAAIAPAMTGSSYHEGWTYQGGALQLGLALWWTALLARDGALRAGDNEAAGELSELLADPGPMFRSLPLRSALPAQLREYARFLDDWLAHPDYDDYWRGFAPKEHYDAIQLPALHVAGWYDVFLHGVLENYSELTRRARARQLLVVGPWFHNPWSCLVGAADFGAGAANAIDELQLRFFDSWLKGTRTGLAEEPPVRLFVMGLDQWRSFEAWPPPNREFVLFLRSEGKANSLNGDGRLLEEPPQAGEYPDLYAADPAAPVLSLGGRSCCDAALTPMGPADQRSQEIRNCVLVYDSEPLSDDLVVIGTPALALFAASDAPSVDFVARLVDVRPCGEAISVCEGNVRLSGARLKGVIELELALAPTAFCFRAGHRLRLEIASSNFPMLDRNPQSGVDPAAATWADLRVATQTVFHDSRYRSRLRLPRLDQ